MTGTPARYFESWWARDFITMSAKAPRAPRAHRDHDQPRPASNGPPGRAPRREPGPAPAPKVTDTLAVIAGIGLGLAVALAFWGESLGALRAPGGWVTLAGRLSALVGTYLMLVMVVLMSRIPWLERSVGQDRLVRWHRRIGGWPIGLIALHITLVTWGYAQASSVSFLRQFWIFIVHYPDIPEAIAAFVLL